MGKVDCVAMIRTAFQQYSQKLAAQTPTTVGGLRNHAVEAGYECLPLAGNEGKLVPGMAVYWYDPNHKTRTARCDRGITLAYMLAHITIDLPINGTRTQS